MPTILGLLRDAGELSGWAFDAAAVGRCIECIDELRERTVLWLRPCEVLGATPMSDEAWTVVKFVLLLATAGYGMYHKWINANHVVAARECGIQVSGIYWAWIDVSDQRCPVSLRDEVLLARRRGLRGAIILLSLLILGETFSRAVF